MSRGSEDAQETRVKLLTELAREFRRLNAHGAAFFRAAAARTGMTVNDLQVIDILDNADPLTAGQLADLTGLTTGAITGMLNRLEEAGLVRRERDPNDGRRIIVQLISDKDTLRKVRAIFDASGQAWAEVAAEYDGERLAFLLDFLKRGAALAQQDIVQLRETSADEARDFSAPLGDLTSGRFVASGIGKLTIRAGTAMEMLYQARFEGPAPDVKIKDGAVTIRYPRRLNWLLGLVKRSAEVTLNNTIPWHITIQGGGAEIVAELDGLDLAGVEVNGGSSLIDVRLPAPTHLVPVRISGAASEISVQRPTGVAARVHLKGRASVFNFDGQGFSSLGNDARMQSPGFTESAPGYDIEINASVSTARVTTE